MNDWIDVNETIVRNKIDLKNKFSILIQNFRKLKRIIKIKFLH